MKAVVFSVVLFLTLSVSIPANGASLPESDLELQLLRAPSTSLVVHSRNRRAVDVYDFTRYLIANLIADLQNAVNAVSNAVGNLTTTIRKQRDQFLANLNSSVQDIITQVETVIENVVNITQALTGAISQCVDKQRSAAQTLVETTVANLSGCLNNTLTGINSILWDARNLADSASSLAQNISAKVPSCGTASWSNFVQVGSCLNQILRDQQPAVDVLINKISNAVVRAGFVVTGIPTNLVICSGTSIAQAGFTGLQIAQNIRTCTGNALGGMQSYSSKTYFGNVRGPPIKYVDYDMLYDKTPYNPKSKRGDRREQKISWRNIWEQEKEKGVASTSHFMYGRPKRKQYDYAIKEFCRKTDDKEFRSKRLETALQWALPLDMSKFTPL